MLSLRYPISRYTFSGRLVAPLNGAIAPPWYLVSHGHICAIPQPILQHIARYLCDTPQKKQARKSFLGSVFGSTDFSRIFIFGPPDFFSSFLWEKVPRKILQENPRQNPPKFIQQKSPTTSFCRGSGHERVLRYYHCKYLARYEKYRC